MSKNYGTNRNGISYIIDENGIHCTYYVGDGVEFKKTFQKLTRQEISRLTIEDLIS